MLLLPDHLGFDHTGNGGKAHGATGNTETPGKSSRTAGAVAAHLGNRAVAVVELPAKIFIGTFFDQDQAVGAGRESAPADQLGKLRLIRRRNKAQAVVDDDKIVTGAAHLGYRDREFHIHPLALSTAANYLTEVSFEGADSLAGSPVSIAVTE